MADAPTFWPRNGLPPRKVTAEIVPATTSGGRALTAVEQVVSFDAGFWQIILDEIPVASRNNKLLWWALAALLDGRAGLCLVPIYDTGPQNGVPWPLDANGNQILPGATVPHSDGAYFSDGTGYDQLVISATVSANAYIGAVVMALHVFNADVLQPGMRFSVGDRLFKIKKINSSVFHSDDTADYNLTITPPLREDIAAGATANFDDPRCICRLETDQEMFTGIDDYAGRTVGRVSFVEAINS